MKGITRADRAQPRRDACNASPEFHLLPGELRDARPVYNPPDDDWGLTSPTADPERLRHLPASLAVVCNHLRTKHGIVRIELGVILPFWSRSDPTALPSTRAAHDVHYISAQRDDS